MQLHDVQVGYVVQNIRNSSFYRLERIMDGRARIRPLELFPNGLLIERPFDTTVDQDLEVQKIAIWAHDMWITATGAKQPQTYTRELHKLEDTLVELNDHLPFVDPRERGSFINKVRATEARIDVLHRGLSDSPPAEEYVPVMAIDCAFGAGDMVQLPSGFLARVMETSPPMALIRTKHKIEGLIEQMVPVECLRPWHHRHQATV